MTKKLVWRLGKLPTVSELTELVNNKIITQEEAREILLNHETEDDRDKKSLESEIKFLRELVEKLSQNRERIVETIREVKVPYYQYRWYKPYDVWCSTSEATLTTNSAAMYLTTADNTTTKCNVVNFASIKTF